MKTIYNEKQYAERCIIKKQINAKNGLTLSILCKYYYLEREKNTKQILKLLSKFIDESNGIYEKELLPELINKYANENCQLINVKSVKITLDEIAVILSRESEQEQRLLFAILVAYKFKNERNKLIEENKPHVDNRIITGSFGEYFKDAKISPTKENKTKIMGKLFDDNLLLLDNSKTKTLELNFINEDSPTAFEIKYQNDIWVDLEIYKGNEQYKRCECCGDAIKIVKRKTAGAYSKYCSEECYEYMRKLMTINSRKAKVDKIED